MAGGVNDWPGSQTDEELGKLLGILERFERFADHLPPDHHRLKASLAMREALTLVREECAKRALSAATRAVYGAGFRPSRPADVPPSSWERDRRRAS